MLLDERQRRDELEERRERQFNEQMMEMREWMERSQARENERQRQTSKMEQLKLTKLAESEDIESYLTTFERMMREYEVAKERWSFRLAPQLTRWAQLAYASLSSEDAADYPMLKEAILRCYDINEETHQRKFRSARRKEGEGFAELEARLRDMIRKWMSGCENVEAVFEKLLVEQLLNAMPSDLRVWVGERKPETGKEAGKLADDYIQARQRDGRPQHSVHPTATRKCHSCGSEKHFARNCPQKPGAECNKFPGSDNFKQESSKKTFRKPLKCYNCGEVGHISTQCPSKALYCRD